MITKGLLIALLALCVLGLAGGGYLIYRMSQNRNTENVTETTTTTERTDFSNVKLSMKVPAGWDVVSDSGEIQQAYASETDPKVLVSKFNGNVTLSNGTYQIVMNINPIFTGGGFGLPCDGVGDINNPPTIEFTTISIDGSNYFRNTQYVNGCAGESYSTAKMEASCIQKDTPVDWLTQCTFDIGDNQYQILYKYLPDNCNYQKTSNPLSMFSDTCLVSKSDPTLAPILEVMDKMVSSIEFEEN